MAKPEEIEKFFDLRKAEIDKWENKDTHKERVGAAYWWWHDKKDYRVFEVGDNLEEVHVKCVNAEELIAAGNPKVMKPVSKTSAMRHCVQCGHAVGDSLYSCPSCGMPV